MTSCNNTISAPTVRTASRSSLRMNRRLKIVNPLCVLMVRTLIAGTGWRRSCWRILSAYFTGIGSFAFAWSTAIDASLAPEGKSRGQHDNGDDDQRIPDPSCVLIPYGLHEGLPR